MALAKSTVAVLPQPLEEDERLAEKSDSVDASDMSILSSSSSCTAGTLPETMAFEASLLPPCS